MRHDLGGTVGPQIGVSGHQTKLLLELRLRRCAQLHQGFALDVAGLQVGKFQRGLLGAISRFEEQALDEFGETGFNARAIGPKPEVVGLVENRFIDVQDRTDERADDGRAT